jgi:hypothetical protein
MLGSVVDVVLAVAAFAGVVFGVLEHLGKKAAELRADRMSDELANARQELAGTRLAQERLASIEDSATRDARRNASRAASAQRSRNRAEVRAARKEDAATQRSTSSRNPWLPRTSRGTRP